MSTARRGALVLAAAALAGLAGCSSAPPAAPPAPSPVAAPTSTAPATAPATAPTTTEPATPTEPPLPTGPPTDGTNVSACADGTCYVAVRGTRTFPVRTSSGRTVTLTVTAVAPDGLDIRFPGGGETEVSGGGGRVTLPQGLTIDLVRTEGSSALISIHP